MSHSQTEAWVLSLARPEIQDGETVNDSEIFISHQGDAAVHIGDDWQAVSVIVSFLFFILEWQSSFQTWPII